MFRTIQVHIAIYKDNQISHLAIKRSESSKIYPAMWQTVTGTVEANEHAFDAAKRELEEETGLLSDIWFKVPFLGGFFDMKRNTTEQVPAFGILLSDFPNVRLSAEHSAFKWVPTAELDNVFFIPDHVNGALQFEKLIKNPEQQRIFAV